MTAGLGILSVLVCLACQGFFSGSEMALVSANRARLQARADEGNHGARLAVDMIRHNEDRLLGTCLIGTNICLVTGTVLFRQTLLAGGISDELVVTLAFVPFALLLGEALPKVVYRHHADLLAPILASPIRFFSRLFAPLLVVVAWWSRLLKLLNRSEAPSIRREDIVQLLEDETGAIHPGNRQIIQRLLGTATQTTEEAMTPLVDMVAVDEDALSGEAIERTVETGYSRLPVYRERIDNIVGRIDARDLLAAPRDDIPVAQLMKPVHFVPESKRIDELFREMRDQADPMRIVVDEYGGSVGVVTLEDLLEQILGDIEDERDPAAPGIRVLGPGEWRVPARTDLEELEEVIGQPLPPGDYETVAGLLLTALGRIPVAGEKVRVGRLVFHIEAASERAIELVRVQVPSPR